MCWIGFKEQKKIAEKDIICNKILAYDGNKYFAYYMGTDYELNKLYKSELKFNDYSTYILGNEGLHCYSNENNISELYAQDGYCVNVFVKGSMEIAECYSSGPVFKTGGDGYPIKVCELAKPIVIPCIIPKGSIFYENRCGEIISNQLILKTYEQNLYND